MGDSTAALSTELLRTSSDPIFRRLRELLPEHGIDAESDVLAELFSDDVDQEFGVVVTTGRQVFTLVLQYGRTGDLRAQAAAAVLADWTDISTRWESSPYAGNVRDALELIRSGSIEE